MNKEEILPNRCCRGPLMLCLFSTELLFNNASIAACRIACLSNPCKNALILCGILALSMALRLNTNCGYFLLLSCIVLTDSITPALTNTLFSIHPPMLYSSIFLFIAQTSFYKGLRTLIAPTALGVSMFLGGFWSMQELSWGGWWNWDVLECGIGYIWLVGVIFMHKRNKKMRASKIKYSLALITVSFLYTILNKFGLATSIHSFVASKSMRNQYATISAWFAIGLILVIARLHAGLIYYIVLLCITYAWLKWCIFLKKPLIYCYALFALVRYKRVYTNPYSHNIIANLFIITVAYNYLSYSLFYTSFISKSVVHFTAVKPFWNFDIIGGMPSKIIWREMFLSKPCYRLNKHFSSYSTRNPGGRYVTSGFLK